MQTTEEILSERNIPVTRALISMFDEMELCELTENDDEDQASLVIEQRTRSAELYCQMVPQQKFSAAGLLMIFAYPLIHYRGSFIAESMDGALAADVWQLSEDYAYMTGDNQDPYYIEAENFRTCVAINKCYMLSMVEALMSQDIDENPQAAENAESMIISMFNMCEWESYPTFDDAYDRQCRRLSSIFEDETGYKPRFPTQTPAS